MAEQTPFTMPAIWGGIECTINRVGDEFKDQLKYSGHYDRPGDIEAIAELGIRVIRYPILWEKHQPKKSEKIDWNWTDGQLETIRATGMKPVAGLLHHGSGPSYTNLLDPEFPYLLASYAYEVASRYPWIEDYTPVNEPLTTARFSGLYGLWYPHHIKETSFYRMLLNQLKGTVLAMEAISSVNPFARLIQTEDLGKTYSTPLLAYQADFENDRRLLTFEILTGRLRKGNPQYQYMLDCGIRVEEIDFFQEHRFPPHMLGLNYYVTSERWLDESLEQYDHQTHGGNGIHRYADTEIVRTGFPEKGGFKKLATEIWERYGIPMAVTESHLHCTREEQLRWFKEIWDDCVTLAKNGIAIKAITAWALLGSFDWDTLLTKTGTQYESGVFDIKSIAGERRPTAIASLLKNLIERGQDRHPVLSASGWWHGSRQVTDTNSRPLILIENQKNIAGTNSKKLSAMFADACTRRCIFYIVAENLDLLFITKINPWAIINLSNKSLEIEALRSRKIFQYATFCREATDHNGLKIIAENLRMNIHQVDKILDLIIDGEHGSWIFSSDTIFKTENADDFTNMTNITSLW